jgi:hypothetical protein
MILRRLDDDNSNKITAVITLDCQLGPHSTRQRASIPSHPIPIPQCQSTLLPSYIFISFPSFIRSSFRTHMTIPAPR